MRLGCVAYERQCLLDLVLEVVAHVLNEDPLVVEGIYLLDVDSAQEFGYKSGIIELLNRGLFERPARSEYR